MIDVSGWRKRQIALDQKAENAKELGLNYAPAREPRWKEWRGLTDEEIEQAYMDTNNFQRMGRLLENILKEKNT